MRPRTAPPPPPPAPMQLRITRRYFPNFKVYAWPPPDNAKGPLLGWDENHEPFIIFKYSDAPYGGVSEEWKGFGFTYNCITGERRVTAYDLESLPKLIKHWAFSPMGPDAEAYEREMQAPSTNPTRPEQFIYPQPQTLVPRVEPGLLGRIISGIMRK